MRSIAQTGGGTSAAAHASRLRLAIVTNEPAPYRVPVYSRIARDSSVDLLVCYACRREPNRHWDLPPFEYEHRFLRERTYVRSGRFIHNNPDVITTLASFRPDVILTTGFNPTHLYAFGYAKFTRRKHVAMTDGTTVSEAGLSRIHRIVRRWVYGGSQAFVAASEGGIQLFRSYGLPPERLFQSHLCANNELFFSAGRIDKRFDFIFSGRFTAVKNPLFAINVVRAVSQRLGRKASIAFIGSGEMEAEMRAAAQSADVDAQFLGFARQPDLPQRYGAARVFLFPTLWDPWGVVANEACAAGLPVIVTPEAGVANELIVHGENGYVLPAELDSWADAAAGLLSDETRYRQFSDRSRDRVREYSYDNAAAGILKAARLAVATV